MPGSLCEGVTRPSTGTPRLLPPGQREPFPAWHCSARSLCLWDGAVPGATGGEGARRGSPAGLGSSAGRAGLQELRGRGGSRASPPARWQLLGARSTHRELVGSLGVSRAHGADGQGVWGQKPIELGEGWTRNCGSPLLWFFLSSLLRLRVLSLFRSRPHGVRMGTRCSPHATPAGESSICYSGQVCGRCRLEPLTPKNVWI